MKQFLDLLAFNHIKPEIIKAFETTPRSYFIHKNFLEYSFEDIPLPIGFDQTISQPSLVAFMTHQLEVEPNMKILEIGTGSGFQAAILSRLCSEVYTIERLHELYDSAKEVFQTLNLINIHQKHGDGNAGWNEHAPFDRIMVTASAKEIPQKLIEQLKDGGIMIVPVKFKDKNYEDLIKITKEGDSFKQEIIEYVRFVPLLQGVK
jgi:protein-L-isoaspartate(D-aspartate) O-methyltransferase